jgi:L-lactate dehydrogenase complex protein LldG
MSDARSAILGSVRAALGPEPADAASIAAAAQALLAEPERGRPKLGEGPLVDLFAARLVEPKIGASVARVGGLDAVPGAVAQILADAGLDKTIALQPAADLLRLDWAGFQTKQTVAPDEAVAVGLALWGIAETGSLVFHSAPDSPTLFCFFPMHHIVVARAERIHAYLEDYATLAGAAVPRNVNLVTGASGTTDIEGTLVKGAHGPGHLHVIIVEAQGR